MENIKKKKLSPKQLRSEIKSDLGVDVKETDIKEYVKHILKTKQIGKDCEDEDEDDGAVGAGAGGERLYQEDVDIIKATRESKLMSDYKKAKAKFEQYKAKYLSTKDKKSLQKMRDYKKQMDEYGEQLLLEEGIDPSTVFFGSSILGLQDVPSGNGVPVFPQLDIKRSWANYGMKRKTSHLKKHQQTASEVMKMWSDVRKDDPSYTLKEAWSDYRSRNGGRKSHKKAKRRMSHNNRKTKKRRNLKRARSFN